MKYRAPHSISGNKKRNRTPPRGTEGPCAWCGRDWKLAEYPRFTDSESEFVDVGFVLGSSGKFEPLCPNCTGLMDIVSATLKGPAS
jgi:hypothetical protein